jgi:hypothetical protein
VLAAGKTVGSCSPAGLRLMRSFSPGFGPKAHDVVLFVLGSSDSVASCSIRKYRLSQPIDETSQC